MNIVIYNPGDGRSYVRPDTSWERENKDLYVPQDVDGYWYSPILFARVCKAGKCIGERFSERYYDSMGFGTLLYAGEDAPGHLFSSSCHDHTTVLPFPLMEKSLFGSLAKEFTVLLDQEVVYFSEMKGETCIKMIEEALCKASEHISLRIGDFIAIELCQIGYLTETVEGCSHNLTGKLGDDILFDFKVIK